MAHSTLPIMNVLRRARVLVGMAVIVSRVDRAECFTASPKFSFGSSPAVEFGKGSSSSSSHSQQQVIEAAKQVMANGGYFNPLDESLFADDFIFRGPVIGPLNKADYKEVLDYFSIYKAFPDMDPNCFGYTVDPEHPFRVWFLVRATGTYQNPLGGPLGTLIRPKNQVYRGSTETWSLVFDGHLKCRLMTAGYVSDRYEDYDNGTTTNGVGLSFGILETLGLSLPSGPGNFGLRFIQAINGPLVALGLTPKAVSAPSEVPDWWSSEKRGADP